MKLSIPHPKVKHLTSRAAFGLGLQVNAVEPKELFRQAEKIVPLHIVDPPSADEETIREMRKAGKNAGDSLRKQIISSTLAKSRENLMKINTGWIDKMTNEPSLREKMTFFWHGHFACRTLVPWFAQQLNNSLRTFALESFSELLTVVAKDPAMLQFLNNQQNKKDHPNENFAREVMELFTLGRGNYSEQDIREGARAFTGWGFNLKGEFQFRPRQHDFGTKTFRGSTKDFSGEQILQSILEDRKTAQFISTKLYRFFVSDQPPAPGVIDSWADGFYRSGYDIQKLLSVIFDSDVFNDPSNMGNRIKSPVELITGILLQTDGKFENPQSVVFLQRALGQVLFYPPNVSGWPSGKAWIDSSSLTFRLALPMLMFGGAETDLTPSDDGDANGLGKTAAGKKRLHCKADWTQISNRFTKGTSTETLELIESYLLPRPTLASNRNQVAGIAGQSQKEDEFVKKAFIGFMSLPEYQLC